MGFDPGRWTWFAERESLPIADAVSCATFDDFYQAFLGLLRRVVAAHVAQRNRTESQGWRYNPCPLLSSIVREVKRHGTGIVCLWTAGNIEVLLPMLMDNGINCIWCLERGSGMDPVAIRKKYGRSLLLGGGMPKEAMIEGPAAIDRELARLLPLIREGGYLPALDDVVPPEVPFDTYRYYVDALRAVAP